ncbi:MAG TPA: sigma-70 family RNA polymerase sigma factor [Pirellulaceae bacterium]|jgi:RNA polymerase sigma-70 factor (ECF subfamily)|nr:sigma-70 family RNA polymerase sigma factor [Pirellulaceae bacterium]
MSVSDESVWADWERLRFQGDPRAFDELLRRTRRRLESLARKMLRGYPKVRRWEQTDDVLQEALLRLDRALREAPPNDARHFFNLATVQIRRTLLDLARRHQGPMSLAANHDSAFAYAQREGDAIPRAVVEREPVSLEDWTAFHEAVGELPEDEREVFQLTWYQGLSQRESAQLMGVDERTVRRYRLSAKLQLARRLNDPDSPR